MARRKLKSIEAQSVMLDECAPSVALVTADEQHAATPSPAKTLQDALQQSLDHTAGDKKVPFGWTMLGLVAACGLFWVGVFSLLS